MGVRNVPYLRTPKWAKHVLSMVYSLVYLIIGMCGVAVMMPPNPHVLPLLIVGIMILSSILAIYAVLNHSPHWEWAAIWFILGGVIAYVVIDWSDVIHEVVVGGPMLNNLLLEAGVATVAALFLLARAVLLTVAAQENRDLLTRKR